VSGTYAVHCQACACACAVCTARQAPYSRSSSSNREGGSSNNNGGCSCGGTHMAPSFGKEPLLPQLSGKLPVRLLLLKSLQDRGQQATGVSLQGEDRQASGSSSCMHAQLPTYSSHNSG